MSPIAVKIRFQEKKVSRGRYGSPAEHNSGQSRYADGGFAAHRVETQASYHRNFDADRFRLAVEGNLTSSTQGGHRETGIRIRSNRRSAHCTARRIGQCLQPKNRQGLRVGPVPSRQIAPIKTPTVAVITAVRTIVAAVSTELISLSFWFRSNKQHLSVGHWRPMLKAAQWWTAKGRLYGLTPSSSGVGNP